MTWSSFEEKLAFVSHAAQRPNRGVCLENAQIQKLQTREERKKGEGWGMRLGRGVSILFVSFFFLSSRVDIIKMT